MRAFAPHTDVPQLLLLSRPAVSDLGQKYVAAIAGSRKNPAISSRSPPTAECAAPAPIRTSVAKYFYRRRPVRDRRLLPLSGSRPPQRRGASSGASPAEQ